MITMYAKKLLKNTPVFDVYILWTKYKVRKSPIKETKKNYHKFYGKSLNLKNPQLLSEKIQYLKLFDYPKNSLVIKAADKYTIRDYLESKSFEKYEMPFIEIYNNPKEMNFEKLPQKFVLKKTNASGLNLIVKDKSKTSNKKLKKLMKKWLVSDYGDLSAEYHYYKKKNAIICEPFIEELGNEYRMFMVGGKLAFVQVIIWYWNEKKDKAKEDDMIEGHRKHSRVHLDRQWKVIWKDEDVVKTEIPKPHFFNEMERVSSIISKDFPVVRIDFNEVNDDIKITELTFTPASGFLEILRQRPELDKKLGTWIDLEMFNEKNNQ